MFVPRAQDKSRREHGFTLIEVLVTVVVLLIAGTFITSSIMQSLQQKVEARQLAVANNWVRAIDKSAGSADYADLGFYTGQLGAPTSTEPISVPVNSRSAPLSEAPVVLGDGALVRSSSFPVVPSMTVAAAAPDPDDATPLTDSGASYKIETWVTHATPADGIASSPGKRITVRVQWGKNPALFDGTCRAGVRCITQSLLRPADSATSNPLDGADAGASGRCRAATPAVCDTYVRSGRVLGLATLNAGGTAPSQIANVDLAARTTVPADSLEASWTFQTASGPRTVTQALVGDEAGTAWAATIPADEINADGTAAQIKAKILPGSVQVTFTATFGGTSAQATTQASWSYTVPSDRLGAHVQAGVVLPEEGDPSWCSPTGEGSLIVAYVDGLSAGFTETDPITAADDRVDFLFTVTDPGGATRSVTVPASVVPGSVSAMDEAVVDDHGVPFSSASRAWWMVAAPPSSDCSRGTTVLIRVHRAVDQSTTVVPATLTPPGPDLPPNAPTGLRLVSLAGRTATVAWDPVPFADAYLLEGANLPVATVEHQATITGDAGQTVTLTVSASNAAGSSLPSEPLSLTFAAVPSAPTGLKVVSSTTSAVTVAWNPAANATEYVVKSGSFSSTVSGTQAMVPGTPGSTVSISVAGKNASGAGPAASISVTLPKGTVDAVQVTRMYGLTANLSWAAFPGATSYVVASGTGQSVTVTGPAAAIALPSDVTTTLTVTAKSGSTEIATGQVVAQTAPSRIAAGAMLYRGPSFAIASDIRGTVNTPAGSSIVSADGGFAAVFQSDGNFLVFNLTNATVVATANTGGGSATYLTYQSDGNFVLYSPAGALKHTQTNGYAPGWVGMQPDGNLVLYDAGGVARWASNAFAGAPNNGAGTSFMVRP